MMRFRALLALPQFSHNLATTLPYRMAIFSKVLHRAAPAFPRSTGVLFHLH